MSGISVDNKRAASWLYNNLFPDTSRFQHQLVLYGVKILRVIHEVWDVDRNKNI